MARIIRRRQAIRDVMDLWQYIAVRSSTTRADAFVDKIDEKLNALATQPEMGRRRDELLAGLRSLPVNPYLIFYFPLEDGIEVVHIIHGRQDIEAIFEGEEEIE